MDAVVHVCYEVAGTAGAFASAALIKKLGNNYSFIITPIFFAIAGIIWRFVDANFDDKKAVAEELEGEGLTIEDKPSRGVGGYLIR